jgi:dihydrolipoamide dehydrogenase
METKQHDLLVIGAGPGGYVAAIRAAQLGLNVGIIEKADVPGGTCLRVGCIPSKAMLESSERYIETLESLKEHGIKVGDVELDLATMQKRKEKVVLMLTKGVAGLLKKNKIAHYVGHGKFTAPGRVVVQGDKGETTIEAGKVLIATGSKPAPLSGVEVDGDKIGGSTEALAYSEVPKHLVVIGAGYIGLELGSVWKRLGAKVTVLEYLDRILPGMDSELASEAQKVFEKQGIQFRLGTKVLSAKAEGDEAVVQIEGGEPVRADKVLLAVGRIPNTDNLGLEEIGVQMDQRGRIAVDQHFKTSVENVYAIGDVIAGPMLAHNASEEGVACVESLVTG